jgi:hypothetical protein
MGAIARTVLQEQLQLHSDKRERSLRDITQRELTAVSVGLAVAAHVAIVVILARGSHRASGPVSYPAIEGSTDSGALSGLPATRQRNFITLAIVDQASGAPIEGAAVRELSMESPAHTGASGTVTFAARPGARTRVAVTHGAYDSVLVSVPNLERNPRAIMVRLRKRT